MSVHSQASSSLGGRGSPGVRDVSFSRHGASLSEIVRLLGLLSIMYLSSEDCELVSGAGVGLPPFSWRLREAAGAAGPWWVSGTRSPRLTPAAPAPAQTGTRSVHNADRPSCALAVPLGEELEELPFLRGCIPESPRSFPQEVETESFEGEGGREGAGWARAGRGGWGCRLPQSPPGAGAGRAWGGSPAHPSSQLCLPGPPGTSENQALVFEMRPPGPPLGLLCHLRQVQAA